MDEQLSLISHVKAFFTNQAVKRILNYTLPSISSVLLSLSSLSWWCLGLGIGFFIINLFTMSKYAKIEEEEHKNGLIRTLFSRDKSDLFRAYSKVTEENCRRLFSSLPHFDANHEAIDWGWIEKRGDELCDAVYQFVRSIAKSGDDFAVSIIFKKGSTSNYMYSMTSRIKPNSTDNPKMYRTWISEAEANGKYYKTLLDESFSKTKICVNQAEVKECIKDHPEKFSQFIAIPIIWPNGTTIGLLQIAVYSESIIFEKKKDLKRLCDTYLHQGRQLMILTDCISSVDNDGKGELSKNMVA